MRIISGKYGGRVLKAPKDNSIRPTSDKVRGAIFNALQSRGAVDNAHVLDCFCGTGALGIEALSIGAQDCLFFDKNRKSLDLAKENAATLGMGPEASFFLKNIQNLQARPDETPARTLAFIDPPYGQGLVDDTLDILNIRDWLESGAICVIEAESSLAFETPKFYELLDRKDYGDTQIIYLRYSF